MRGRGSAGRASPCQGEGRGFESRRPLGANLAQSQWGEVFPGGVAERRGNGLQIRVHGFKSRLHLGRLAQWERASLTRKRSLVQIQYRPPVTPLISQPLRHLRNIWRLDRLTCRPNFWPIARRPIAWRRHLRARRWRAPARDNWAQFIPVHALRDDMLPWPTKCAIFLDGHPELDSNHTELRRNSRKVHSVDRARRRSRPGGTNV